MQLEVHTVNAFVDGHEGGNPAGVVLDANSLSSAQELTVAQQMGLSETAFVSASSSATLKLEFFTPTRLTLRDQGGAGECKRASHGVDGRGLGAGAFNALG
jgi:PhzF family phenazine biosynthesis protein